ncbi:MAG: RNA methyltransferase [Cyanobacteria bacterium P01_A01_bin.123]
MAGLLDHIRIVLVEPAGALNVGSIARVMANMGLSRLVLVNSHCDPLGEEALRMAVHADGVLHQAQQVADLSTALVGCQRAIATTARPRADMPLETPEAALPWLLNSDSDVPLETALIFGPEDRGLSNGELNYAQRYVMIPANPAYPSLNLAQAVAVCGYVLRHCADAGGGAAKLAQIRHAVSSTCTLPNSQAAPTAPSQTVLTAPIDQIDGYFQHLEAVLLKIGYLYPHTASSRLEKLRRLLYRAEPSEQEVSMLRGILRQVEWALDRASSVAVDTVDEAETGG